MGTKDRVVTRRGSQPCLPGAYSPARTHVLRKCRVLRMGSKDTVLWNYTEAKLAQHWDVKAGFLEEVILGLRPE